MKHLIKEFGKKFRDNWQILILRYFKYTTTLSRCLSHQSKCTEMIECPYKLNMLINTAKYIKIKEYNEF